MLQSIYFIVLFVGILNPTSATQYNYSLFYPYVNNIEGKSQKSNYLYSEISPFPTNQISFINFDDPNNLYNDLNANEDYILNNKEFSLLHLGVVTQDIAMIQMALMHDKSLINSQDINGCTPLHLAVLTDNLIIVEILIRLGADVNIINKEYETPIFNAVKNDSNIMIIEYLISEGALLYGENKNKQSLEDIIELYKRDHLKDIFDYSTI